MLNKLLILIAMLFVFETVLARKRSGYALKYTEETFPIEMAKKDHFVMFYTTWCRHSRQLEPKWERLAKSRNQRGRVKIAKVDCDADGTLCTQNNVYGYPTIKFFVAGYSNGIEYNGDRTVHAFNDFINEQLQ